MSQNGQVISLQTLTSSNDGTELILAVNEVSNTEIKLITSLNGVLKMRRFEEKNVIVTGGSTGIGRSCIEKFLEEGAKVFNLDIKKPDYSHENLEYTQWI